MPHAQLIAAVRRLVGEALARVDRDRLDHDGADPIRESILIREGLYCGRRFETSAGYAIWFVEENQVKIFERTGRVVDVLQLDDVATVPQTHRLAA
jgi:hypothetical protein